MLTTIALALAGTPTVVARRELPPGHVIGSGDVEMGDVPVLVPADVGFDAVDPLLGRTVRARVRRGAPVRADQLAGEDASGLGALVPFGMRAVRLPLSPGLVRAGDAVHLLATDGGQVTPVLMAVPVVHTDGTGVVVAVTADQLAPLVDRGDALHVVAVHPRALGIAPTNDVWDLGPPGDGEPAVWVASRPLLAGFPIRESDLMAVPLPDADDPVPAGWLDAPALIGATLLEPVQAGQPLTREDLVGDGVPCAAALPPGHVLVGREIVRQDALDAHLLRPLEAP